MHEIVGTIGMLMVIGVLVYGIVVVSKPHEFHIK